jgi:Outer membrane protein beta-barrel domain
MLRLIYVLTLLLLVLIVTTPSADAQSDLRHEIEVRGVYLIPTGEVSLSNTQTSGTTIDFERDFDLPNRFGIDLKYTYRSENRKHKLWVGYARSSYSSTTTLTRTIEFLGQTYTANLQIKSERTLSDLAAGYSYRWGTENFRIGPMGTLGFVKPEVTIDSVSNTNISRREGSITKFAALIGYDLDYDPSSRINIFHNLGAIAYKRDRLFHAEGGIRVYPSEHFGVSGGYKFVNYKLVDGINFISAREHGPFIGGLLRF